MIYECFRFAIYQQAGKRFGADLGDRKLGMEDADNG
jgi:hypothetical protein